MESKCDRQKESIKTYTDEISRIEAALFNAKSEVKTLLFNRTNNAVEAA
jgi:hypothetical protein